MVKIRQLYLKRRVRLKNVPTNNVVGRERLQLLQQRDLTHLEASCRHLPKSGANGNLQVQNLILKLIYIGIHV